MSVILDNNVLLSTASIWQRQCDFYAREGTAAWYNQVPFYATSNAFIARAYADMMIAFMDDWHAQHGNQLFHIVELGAGSGQFAYLCMQSLAKHAQAKDYQWQYVMTDFDEKLISFWRNHSAFQPFLTHDQLLFAQATAGQQLDQLGEILADSDGPVMIVANYLFDSLPADIYKVSNEQLFPVAVTVTTDEDNLDEQHQIADFENVTMHCEASDQPYASDNVLLEQYRLELLDSYILYPTASIELLDQLKAILPQGMLLLATDKAYGSAEELDYLEPPELTGHNGCFSMMVNFDCIARYAKLHQGSAAISSIRAGIKTAVFGIGFSLSHLERLRASTQHYLQQFAPTDYLNMYRNMQKKLDSFSLEEAMSMLALSNWDATVFQRLYKVIFGQLDGADMLTINYLLDHLPVIAAHYYWLEEGEDLLFQIAVVFHTLKKYHQALEYYELSLQYFPGIFGLYFNMGVCHHHLGQAGLARERFEQALQLDPDNPQTKEWLARLT